MEHGNTMKDNLTPPPIRWVLEMLVAATLCASGVHVFAGGDSLVRSLARALFFTALGAFFTARHFRHPVQAHPPCSAREDGE